ncbi:MAG: aminotransferase class V-fold PLP-dependent enzyme [Candidatus Magasanikbacteria bacterium]
MNSASLNGQFPQLNGGKVYADWTGAALPPISLIEGWSRYLQSTLLGNPHSHHKPSATAMQGITQARAAILQYFNANADEYEVIFTSGATAAIRILQHFLFEGGEYLLTADNHNSVNGLREDARRQGAIVRYAPISDDLTLDEATLTRMLTYPRSMGNRLFAYPAKSNYSGIHHSLSWVNYAQSCGWSVLLDAAAYCGGKRLNLSKVKPDFVPISFYKLFGYPTGVGCMIIKRSAYAKLHKRWFAGGSILLVSVTDENFYAPETLGYARFEDGTLNFANIPAVVPGLQFMESLGDICEHATVLGVKLYDSLQTLHEGDNSIIIHSPRGTDIVTFSVKRGQQIVDAWVFERYANEQAVFVRTGCFCNPGVNEKVFGYKIDAFKALYNSTISNDAITIDNLRRHIGGDVPIGAIRASFGYANTEMDVNRIVAVTRQFLRSL